MQAVSLCDECASRITAVLGYDNILLRNVGGVVVCIPFVFSHTFYKESEGCITKVCVKYRKGKWQSGEKKLHCFVYLAFFASLLLVELYELLACLINSKLLGPFRLLLDICEIS